MTRPLQPDDAASAPFSSAQAEPLLSHRYDDEPPYRPAPPSLWFAADPSKAYYEKFSLIWAPLSMFVLLAVLLGTPLYKYCDRNSFLLITIVGCLPGVLIPLLYPCEADRHRPILSRFWVKGSIWIIIFDFYGNYFWTHYFYSLLGARYLFDSYRFNDVPVVTFTATFFYFSFYFNFATVILRRIDLAVHDFPPFGRRLIWVVSIALLSYSTAIFEAVSIQHFPLYTYTNREVFLTVGSVVYALYFIIGFPTFFSLDEPSDVSDSSAQVKPSSAKQVAVNALAACATVTLLLDLWRLLLGSIYQLGLPSAKDIALPFIYQSTPSPTPSPPVCTATPTPNVMVFVDRPVTTEACVALLRKWAGTRLPFMRAAQ